MTSAFNVIPTGGSSTEKRTVVTTMSSSSLNDDAGDRDFYYRSSITPRASHVQRTSTSSAMGPVSPGGGRMLTRTMEVSTSGFSTPSLISMAPYNNVKVSREKEKKDMQDLNERFASYIEKVRGVGGG